MQVAPTNAAFICGEHGCPGDTHVVACAFGLLIELNRDHIEVEVVSDDGLLKKGVELGGPLVLCVQFVGFSQLE